MEEKKARGINQLRDFINDLVKQIYSLLMDDLTGVLNRNGLKSIVFRLCNEMIKGRIQYDKTGDKSSIYSFLVLDSKGLKRVNEELGHKAGDYELERATNTLKQCIRNDNKKSNRKNNDYLFYIRDLKKAIAARIGGDEFLIILPGCTKEDAEIIKNRINRRIEEDILLRKEEAMSKGIDPNSILGLTFYIGISDTTELPIPQNKNKDTLLTYFNAFVNISDKRMFDDKHNNNQARTEEQKINDIIPSVLRISDLLGINITTKEGKEAVKHFIDKAIEDYSNRINKGNDLSK